MRSLDVNGSLQNRNTLNSAFTAINGQLTTVQFLMEQGADWKAKNINGQNALDLARMFFKTNIVQYLESKGETIFFTFQLFYGLNFNGDRAVTFLRSKIDLTNTTLE